MSFASQIRPVSDRSTLSAFLRLIAGCVTAFVVTILWLFAVVLLLSVILGRPVRDVAMSLFAGTADNPPTAMTMLILVAGLGLGTLLAARLWQKRGAASLFGPGAKTMRHFVVGAGATFAVIAVISLIPPWDLGAPRSALSVQTWAMWLPFAVIAVIAQTGAEEVFFRGYLQSELAARFRAPPIWLFLPAIAFGFAHLAPGLPAQNVWLYVTFAFLFGVLAGDLTARTGSIGAGWGFHFANNAMALLIVATPGSITGLGLYLSDRSLGEPITVTFALFYDLAAVLAVWVLIRRLLRV